MKANWSEVIRFPFKDNKWWVKILISIVPIANLGYLLRILKDACMGKQAALPEWDGWEDLFKNGVMALIIWIVYLIPLLVLDLLGLAPGVGLLFKLLAIAAGVIVAPCVTIALCKYLENNQLKDAFDFKGVIEKLVVAIKDYLIVAIIFSVLFSVLCVIAIASVFTICLFPVIFLCVFYVSFYLMIIVTKIYGDIYRSNKK